MNIALVLGILIPFLGTVIGSSFVFLMKDGMNAALQKTLLGFASGVMVAASVWSLLIPSIEVSGASGGIMKVMPAAIGFMAGMAFLLFIDYVTPHLHLGDSKPEGPRSHLSRTAMLAMAVTIHNLPEGMAVGAVLSGSMADTGITAAGAVAMSLGIAIQNIPEGAIISMPMRTAGNSRWKSFIIGSMSGAVEPVGALAVILLTAWLAPTMPYLLAFAAGAMLYVVVEELIPEASEGEHSNMGTIGFAVGFVVMMVLDVVLG
ncbi:ZIP family metal transporter [Xylanibacter muris]|uniref:ZIP family metal transporter n=1 Tax=Xylanibacter muris TaxID=2736290 RepID=A0ABX2AIU1_9BACT|nr:ZIP family metal transporter [Xylanibacter muris]NPD90993.1 ZIP family metal transporter [Xylanibacter muris]